MKTTANIVAGIVALAGVAAVATNFKAPATPTAKAPTTIDRKSKVALALDTLEQQLQRRFHDRNNITFGYGRIVRTGFRDHQSTIMDVIPKDWSKSLLRDDGKPATLRGSGPKTEAEIADGVWTPIRQLKETLHPENESERQAIDSLKQVSVAIYTVGDFDSVTGKPNRLKGPAYTRLTAPDAPAKETMADLAANAWVGAKDVTEVTRDGWNYRVVKVRADNDACLKCHAGQMRSSQSPRKNYKLNDPLGAFIIGVKQKA